MHHHFIQAVQSGDVSVIRTLCEQHPSLLNKTDGAGKTCLFYAPDLETAQTLILAGLDINDDTTFKGRLFENPDILSPKNILSFGKNGGADPTVLGYLMMHCCQNDHRASKQTEAFIKAGTDLNTATRKVGRTPLMCAYNYFQFRLLLDAGADIRKTDRMGRCVADYHTHFDIIRKIKNAGGQLPPERAAFLMIHNHEENQIDRIKQAIWYMNNGADRDFGLTNERGRVLFSYLDSPVIFNKMLRHGFDPNVRDFDGRTPIMLVSAPISIRMALKYGADVQARDKDDLTALHHAIRFGRTDLANTLILSGANVNARDNQGRTPLMLCQNTESARLLVTHGADINARDAVTGRTPVQHAARAFIGLRQKYDLVQYLLTAGADRQCRDQAGLTLKEYQNDRFLASDTRAVLRMALRQTPLSATLENNILTQLLARREALDRFFK